MVVDSRDVRDTGMKERLMNMVAIYGARVPALLGAMVMAGAAAAADLPYDYS